ncbi:MAG TPA: discoidin domain-containing protein, partial [Acidimicrobiia bacterium]|nr:discoidin domain-containing protein [Acidimicrobiia bacterium]
GKFADLVVLSQDPTAIDPTLLPATEALMTMVGGNVEFCRDGSEQICGPGADPVQPQPSTECPETGTNLSLGAAATASTSLSDRPAQLAVDGNPDTGWGAGAGPEQWIEIDLGAEQEVTCVRLLVDQFPAGRTVHRVNGGANPDPGMELGVLDSDTDYGEQLQLGGSWTIRYLRVTTVDSPSWVAWLEVEALGGP